VGKADQVSDVRRALETLFRLNASRKVHARQAAAAGVLVSQPGMVLLRRIGEHEPLSVGELARLTHMDPAAAGRQVRQLQHDGLVTRGTSSADGRVIVVRLTPKGRGVWRRLTAVLDRHMEDVLSAWAPGDRATLARLLSRFVDDLRSVHYRSAADERAG
jgi:DNA-binding MarR family transcriptional regulator